jgi:NAD(P)-dependent dehydrogenase (short-subunit alcohol dehydrogenase family)
VLAGDMTRAADRERMLEAAGALNGLVNAAGVMRVAAVEDVSDTDWTRSSPSTSRLPSTWRATAAAYAARQLDRSLQAAARRWEWEALGLDPALDGPSSNRVRVGPARRVRSEQLVVAASSSAARRVPGWSDQRS